MVGIWTDFFLSQASATSLGAAIFQPSSPTLLAIRGAAQIGRNSNQLWVLEQTENDK